MILTRKQATDKETEMKENKAKICWLLLKALQETRMFEDLENLNYNEELEAVEVRFANYDTSINVDCDSGIAMIRDILKGLEGL